MEGVGSRLGRVSSRYGPSVTVFGGPVRRWKKQWVHVSSFSSSSPSVSYHNNSSGSLNGNGGGNTLLLCRWTPHVTESSKSSGEEEEEPPKRKIRYTPIVVLEEQMKEATKSVDDKAKTSNDHSLTTGTTVKDDGACGKPNNNCVCTEAVQAVKRNQLAQEHSYIQGQFILGLDKNHESD